LIRFLFKIIYLFRIRIRTRLKNRYSYLIRPLKIIIDVFIIVIIIFFLQDNKTLDVNFLTYITLFWLITSYFLGYYKVYRYTKPFRLFTLLGKQFLIFLLGYFAYFGAFKDETSIYNSIFILSAIFLSIFCFKFLWFFLLKRYRSLGKNLRKTIVIGYDESSKNIIKLFKSKSNLGYNYLGFFSNKNYNKEK